MTTKARSLGCTLLVPGFLALKTFGGRQKPDANASLRTSDRKATSAVHLSEVREGALLETIC